MLLVSIGSVLIEKDVLKAFFSLPERRYCGLCNAENLCLGKKFIETLYMFCISSSKSGCRSMSFSNFTNGAEGRVSPRS